MIKQIPFGSTPDGTPVTIFELSCPQVPAHVRLMDLGASVAGFDTPARDGSMADIVLGCETVADYLASDACFGATVGPSANRSADAEVIVDGRAYQLPKNTGPNLENNLHTDLDHGLHKRIWDSEVLDEQNAVRFTCRIADGEFGLPGTRTFSALYTLREIEVEGRLAAQLTLEYTCTTDAPTFVNMTNHSYFNLGGHASGTALDHEVQLRAQGYLPLREDCVSRGDVADVAGTPFDFREAKRIGRDIEAADEQLVRAHGYDHCFIIDGYKPDAAPRPALTAFDPVSGRELAVDITTPGAHFYTANWFDGSPTKGGSAYRARDGFAFEPEFRPDNSHHADWEHPVCTPDEPFSSTIVYTASVR